MTIQAALEWGHKHLIAFETARLDAEILLSHVLERSTTFLLSHNEEPLSRWRWWRYQRLVRKRKTGMPVAYLTGKKEFFFLNFEVNRHTLIPRPDTETLVEFVIEYLRDLKTTGCQRQPLLLDVGTGSACIPIAVLSQIAEIKAVATDVSKKALRVAARNVTRHRFRQRVQLIKSDLLRDVPAEVLEGHELIVTANLPYLPERYYQTNPELKFEPHVALHGGEEGVEVYKRLTEELLPIQPRAIFLEVFEFQAAILKKSMPGYHLRQSEPMTGEAQLFILERD